jgi:fused signal recognition particle receptor
MTRLFRKKSEARSKSLWQRIKEVALSDVRVLVRGGPDTGSLARLEEVLLDADFGVASTLRLVSLVESEAKRGIVMSEAQFLASLRSHIESALKSGNSNPALNRAPAGPTVILVIGVNGAGKTTFIGKLASRLRSENCRVLVAAADTFRAGAIDQLRVWSERTGADFVAAPPGSDPAAVSFDAVEAGLARGSDIVIIDTAGRLHTSDDLMQELKKIVRVIGRRLDGAPHETLLVLDGTIGQNAVTQARTFAAAVPVTGIVVTKLDGTAKGGIVVAVHAEIDAPVKIVGSGEALGDLAIFDAAAYAGELLEG